LRTCDGVERIGPRESSKGRAATRKEMTTRLNIVRGEPVSDTVASTARWTQSRSGARDRWTAPNKRSVRCPRRGPENGDAPFCDTGSDLREHGRYALFCYPSPPWRTASSLRARSPI
jgi:hypothetical protein